MPGGEDAAEEQCSGEGEAKGVKAGRVIEAREFDEGGEDRGEDREGQRRSLWLDGGEEQVEHGGPEDGASVSDD